MSELTKLKKAFENGANDDGASLPISEISYYLSWKFILDWEMEGLKGYFYNALPDLNSTKDQINALRSINLIDMANILNEAYQLFKAYKKTEEKTTWELVLAQYDPNNKLEDLDNRISALDNYGIDS